jgi:hypothetical protein
MRRIGITGGFQWLNGSFVEDCETTRGRSPKDIDIITFATRPDGLQAEQEWAAFIHTRPDLFDPGVSKEEYGCDAYFVDLTSHPIQIVRSTHYWFGLFSHQRDTYLWKGLVEVPIDGDDSEIAEMLNTIENDAP